MPVASVAGRGRMLVEPLRDGGAIGRRAFRAPPDRPGVTLSMRAFLVIFLDSQP